MAHTHVNARQGPGRHVLDLFIVDMLNNHLLSYQYIQIDALTSGKYGANTSQVTL